MQKTFNRLFISWSVITVLWVIFFRILDYIFGVNTDISYFECSFYSFVIVWCVHQEGGEE